MAMNNYAPQRYPKLEGEDSTGWILAAEFKARTVEVLGSAGTLKVYESNNQMPPDLSEAASPSNSYFLVGVTSLKDKSFYDGDNPPTVTTTLSGYNIETLGSIWVCAVVDSGTDVTLLDVTLYDNR